MATQEHAAGTRRSKAPNLLAVIYPGVQPLEVRRRKAVGLERRGDGGDARVIGSAGHGGFAVLGREVRREPDDDVHAAAHGRVCLGQITYERVYYGRLDTTTKARPSMHTMPPPRTNSDAAMMDRCSSSGTRR